jgi:hypothetical protein
MPMSGRCPVGDVIRCAWRTAIMPSGSPHAVHTHKVRRTAFLKRVILMSLLTVVGVAAVGGCSAGGGSTNSAASATASSPSSEAKTTGTLTGQVKYIGGPALGSPRPVAGGVVTFAGSGRSTAAMSEQGHFSAELHPGIYVVTATSPDYKSGRAACEAAHPVRVSAGKSASVDVFCQVSEASSKIGRFAACLSRLLFRGLRYVYCDSGFISARSCREPLGLADARTRVTGDGPLLGGGCR